MKQFTVPEMTFKGHSNCLYDIEHRSRSLATAQFNR